MKKPAAQAVKFAFVPSDGPLQLGFFGGEPLLEWSLLQHVTELAREEAGNRDHECAACALRTRCMNWCGCINHATTGTIDSVAGLVCFHEQLAIRVADQTAEVLFAERNPYFLTRFYREDAFLQKP